MVDRVTDAVFDYHDPGWPEQVRAATPGGRVVSVAFDNVGAETWAQSLACLDRAGRMPCSGNKVVLVPDALYGPGAEAAFPPTERSTA